MIYLITFCIVGCIVFTTWGVAERTLWMKVDFDGPLYIESIEVHPIPERIIHMPQYSTNHTWLDSFGLFVGAVGGLIGQLFGRKKT